MSFHSLLPRPRRVEYASGQLPLDIRTSVGGEPSVARWFRRHVGAATGLPLPLAAKPTIEFRIDPHINGHRLEISPDQALVTAQHTAAAHHAAQTLRQLLPPDAFRRAPIHDEPISLPCGVIEDHPRFGWRGCHLDVARHFVAKREVLRFVDLLAMHKLNVLHLHLTDDQGWRIEVPQYPELTRIGSWRERSMIGRGEIPEFDRQPHGGYYTTEDLLEIVSYASEHHITVVPEIDVPGHSQAAIAAYPELGTGGPVNVWDSWGVSDRILAPRRATVDFFRDVLDHVMSLFPSPVICLGGDEVPGATPAHGALLRRLMEHVHNHGRRTSAWDDAMHLVSLPAETIVLSWQDAQAVSRAAEAGNDVLLCPETHFYLDHRQSDEPDEPVPVGFLNTLENVYAYEPPTERVLGLQAQVWTEQLDSPARIDYAAFPRLCAYAEVAWSSERDPAEFHHRLAHHHLPRLDAFGVEYRPLDGPYPWQLRPGVEGRPR
jgi:hexosaminidase